MTEPPNDVPLALAKLSEMTAVGLAEIKGSLALLVQRADHSDRRLDELAARLERDLQELAARHERDHQEQATQLVAQDERIRLLEADRAGRDEVHRAAARRAVWLSLIFAAISIAVTVAITLLTRGG